VALQQRPKYLIASTDHGDQPAIVEKSTSNHETAKTPVKTTDAGVRSVPSMDSKEDKNANADTNHGTELSSNRESNSLIIPRRPFSIHTQRGLRERRIVPSDNDVLRCARKGNVEQLWSLFDQGLASPFDVDEEGYTPLHVGH
jgi:hypothetical protein